MAKMVDIRKKALANIDIAQQQQKIYYDAKHCKDKEKYDVRRCFGIAEEF